MLSRDASRVEAARARVGHTERTLAMACDVRHREEIDRAIGLTMHHFQRIDVWVNNAGHGLLDSVAEMDMAACREMFEDKFFWRGGGHASCHPGDAAAGRRNNYQHIQRGRAHSYALPCSVQRNQVCHECHRKGRRSRIGKRWNSRSDGLPGYVRTAFGENAVQGNELRRVRPKSVRGITAERVARATLQGYLKQKREVIVPWTMNIPVRIYQHFPRLVERAMGRMAK